MQRSQFLVVKNSINILKTELETESMAKQRFEDGDLWVEIDLDLCTGAGECVDVCPEDVYEIVGGKVTVPNIGDCSECAACDGVCPNDAILDHCSW